MNANPSREKTQSNRLDNEAVPARGGNCLLFDWLRKISPSSFAKATADKKFYMSRSRGRANFTKFVGTTVDSPCSGKFIAALDNVYFSRGNHNILENVSIGVGQGEIVTLIGPNGSGKTSILKILLSLLKPDSGSVTRKNGLLIGYMPQKITIEKTMPITVRRFLRLNAIGRNLRELGEVENIAHDMGIGKILKKQLHDISAGQMQRVMLARALLMQPQLLVLDEPTQGLDVQGQEEFYRIIESVKKKYNAGILLVSHDLHVVMAKTDRVICLNRHICCEGHPEDISRHPEYLSLFGQKEIGNRFAIYPHKHDHSH